MESDQSPAIPEVAAKTEAKGEEGMVVSPSKRKFGFRPIFLLPLLFLWVAGLGYGFWYLSHHQTAETSPPASGVRISQEEEKTAFDLVIESPQEEAVIVDEKVSVSGKTAPKALVAIFSDNDEVSVEADENGNFQAELEVLEGINTVNVTAFGENGEEKTVVLDLVYDKQS